MKKFTLFFLTMLMVSLSAAASDPINVSIADVTELIDILLING